MSMIARTLLVVVMVIAMIFVVTRHRNHDKVIPDYGSGSSAAPTPPPTATGPTAKPGPTHELRTITPAQRTEIAAQIAAARAARAEHKPAAPTESKPATPEPNQEYAAYADSFAVGMSDALKSLFGTLGNCVKDKGAAGSHRNAVVQITLDGDPDVGTLITTDAIADGTGQPVTHALDDCVRSALDGAELPPIKEGATLKTQFTFDLD